MCIWITAFQGKWAVKSWFCDPHPPPPPYLVFGEQMFTYWYEMWQGKFRHKSETRSLTRDGRELPTTRAFAFHSKFGLFFRWDLFNAKFRLGDFWKLSSKRSPNDWQLFGLFWKTSLLCKNYIGYFLGNVWKKLGYFFLQHLVTLTPIAGAVAGFVWLAVALYMRDASMVCSVTRFDQISSLRLFLWVSNW